MTLTGCIRHSRHRMTKKRSAAPVQQNQREPKDSKDGENVPVVKQGVDQAQQEQQNEPPHESFPEIPPLCSCLSSWMKKLRPNRKEKRRNDLLTKRCS